MVHGLGSVAHASVVDHLESSSASEASSASAAGLADSGANGAVGAVQKVASHAGVALAEVPVDSVDAVRATGRNVIAGNAVGAGANTSVIDESLSNDTRGTVGW